MVNAVVLLHRQEAADRLRVSVCTVKRWARPDCSTSGGSARSS